MNAQKLPIHDNAQAFFNAIKKWIEDGTPEHKVFNKTCGLCYCARYYGKALPEPAFGLELYLHSLLRYHGFRGDYPFNENDTFNYMDEGNKYKNPQRLAFINLYAE